MSQFVEGRDADSGPQLFVNCVKDYPPFRTDRRVLKKIVEEHVTKLETFAFIQSPANRLEGIQLKSADIISYMITPMSPMRSRSASRAASFRTRIPK
jgi:hypothetical protein